MNKKRRINKERRLAIGLFLWFVLGLSSIVLGWTHFVIWVVSAYIYFILVEPYNNGGNYYGQ